MYYSNIDTHTHNSYLFLSILFVSFFIVIIRSIHDNLLHFPRISLQLLRYTHSDYLVEVRAQVMARDESTEGWLPLQGGGLAKVSIRKRSRLSPEVKGHEYIIYGQRISDQTVREKDGLHIFLIRNITHVRLFTGDFKLCDQ